MSRPCQSTKYSMPSALETRVSVARSQTALAHLKVDGLKVKYVGPGEDDAEAATVRTNFAAPQDCSLYYFEVHVLSKGQLGFIGVGYQSEEVLLSRLPGWDPHSYGYHGDDGFAFNGSGQGLAYGPTYTVGDTIGALLSRVDNTIRYFKNGQDLGVAFRGVLEERLFPCVGLRSRGEEVQVNLGRSRDAPFAADLDSLVASARSGVLAAIRATLLPVAAPGGSPLLTRLLHEHLLHHRCWRTAELIAKDLVQGPPSTSTVATTTSNPALPPAQDVQDVNMEEGNGEGAEAATSLETERNGGGHCGSGAGGMEAGTSGSGGPAPYVALRQATFELVSAGQIEEARALLEKQFGSQLLERHPSLDFKLKVAQFCELVRPGGPQALEAAVTYGRAVLAPHMPKSSSDEELLCDALSLLAYEQPATSPCGHLLSQSLRVGLAEDVDRALLGAAGLPPTSALERLAAQAWTALEYLKGVNHAQALLLDTRTACFGP